MLKKRPRVFSRAFKLAAVHRMMRGEDVGALSRELKVSAQGPVLLGPRCIDRQPASADNGIAHHGERSASAPRWSANSSTTTSKRVTPHNCRCGGTVQFDQRIDDFLQPRTFRLLGMF